MEKETIYMKQLRLISPEVAYHGYNLPVEAPIFVSPNIQTEQNCNCKIDYTPLVYQTGLTIEAQHFHPESGGIYYYELNDPKDLKDFIVAADHANFTPHGWYAILSPLGETIYDTSINIDGFSLIAKRAEAVLVERIQAFCVAHKYRHELTNGALIDPWFVSDRLCPVCPEEHNREDIDFWSVPHFGHDSQHSYIERIKSYKFHSSEDGFISFYY